MVAVTDQHSLLYLFADDFFHQILFYFGAVGGLIFLFWEKGTKKEIRWKSILAWLGLCSFVAFFQCWLDEHHNAQILIDQKATLTSDNNQLQAKFESAQNEITYLRDHQQIVLSGNGNPDSREVQILERLNRENQSLKNEPGKALQKSIIGLAKEMVEFFQKEALNVQKVQNEIMFQPSLPSDQEQRRAQRLRDEQKLSAVSDEMDRHIQAEVMSDYGPRAVALLEQVRERGEPLTGIKESEVADSIVRCSGAGQVASYWGIQECAERLATLAHKMR